ncbi:hypothetical protein TNCV_2240481 [Trichonephila clavipes]|nr:hypothetical protein TNCV_2240481 [Trichonephila clavipes]
MVELCSVSFLSCESGCLGVEVTDLWPKNLAFELSTAEYFPCSGAMHVKYVEAQTCWCGSTVSTFTWAPCVFSNHTKAPERITFGFVVRITCSALKAHSSTHPFRVVPRMRKLDCSEIESGVLSDESRFNLSSDDNRVRV